MANFPIQKTRTLSRPGFSKPLYAVSLAQASLRAQGFFAAFYESI